jgi:hypothetical protein
MLESLAKPENAPAVWSAVAASFAALAAYLSWRTQKQMFWHTFRPELVLSEWKRSQVDDPLSEILTFTSIRNVGRDTARVVVVNAMGLADDNRPTYFMSTYSLPSLAAGETVATEGQIRVFWNNAPKHGAGSKMLPIKVTAWCWDALNIRHVTTLSLMLFQDLNAPVGGAAKIAPGTYLGSQVTSSVPVWKLKLRRSFGKIPVLGRRFRNDA